MQKDAKQAIYWYTKAAEQGHDSAQNNLGIMYINGEGTPKNTKQAIKWFTKAAEQGFASAQFGLGLMYAEGTGTLKDSVLAYTWWNIAVAQGHKKSARNRSIIEKKMTPDQIATAQKLSKEFYSKYVK